MSYQDGHNYYFDLFCEPVEPSSATFTQQPVDAATWTRRGREYFTVAEISSVSVGCVEEHTINDTLYGNERG